MAFFIGVVHLAKMRAARAAGHVAVSQRRVPAPRNPAADSKVICRVPRGDRDGGPMRAVVAPAPFAGEAPRRQRWQGTGAIAQAGAAGDREVARAPVKSLPERLDFARDPRNRGLTVYGGRVAVATDPRDRIAGAVPGGAP